MHTIVGKVLGRGGSAMAEELVTMRTPSARHVRAAAE